MYITWRGVKRRKQAFTFKSAMLARHYMLEAKSLYKTNDRYGGPAAQKEISVNLIIRTEGRKIQFFEPSPLDDQHPDTIY